MKIKHHFWTSANGWEPALNGNIDESSQLVFIFGATQLVKYSNCIEDLKKMFPKALVFGCSTAGGISGIRVLDDSIVATAVYFEQTQIKGLSEKITSIEDSFQIGKKITASLNNPDICHVFVLSDGLNINGSELVRGITKNLPDNVSITGGLSGDGDRFSETYVIYDGKQERNMVAAVGFYGSKLQIGYGSVGGWDPFGPERLVTRSKSNVLYELDGKSALELYKMYLGEQAQNLPASGLLFPLNLRVSDSNHPVVRTLLSINEADQGMVFAGDIPEGSYVRLMKANFDRLIDGAARSAKKCYESLNSNSPDLAILISCVGRKLILKQRIEEEVESVREILGERTLLTGFYSYGEISPFNKGSQCELHNQTMTITAFSERE